MEGGVEGPGSLMTDMGMPASAAAMGDQARVAQGSLGQLVQVEEGERVEFLRMMADCLEVPVVPVEGVSSFFEF